ncbi:helix-turn-helix domain-containing protein [Rhizobium sp. Rhizsp42]|uniref:GlxA family transcriptional regulator n=1 Tax=Rhizobium sp. Rhizsp42 TaxID=3243034 RepID=UPI000DD76B5E
MHGLRELWAIANSQAVAASAARIVAIDVEATSEGSSYLLHGNSKLAAVVAPPMFPGADLSISPTAKTWLAEAARAGTIMCSACGGAFMLGQAGVLDGRSATTHWSLREQFKDRFPLVDLRADDLLVDEVDVITAGGVMAWTQLGLRLVDRFLGTEVMLSTAKFMLIDPADRPQSYYAPFSPQLDHGDLAIVEVQRWLHSSLGKRATLEEMAARARTSPRTFLRRFSRATGFNPTDYCQRLKVSHSRKLLEARDISIDEIAQRCGYEDQNSYRKVFKRLIGITPGEYRARISVRQATGRHGTEAIF